MSLPRSNLLKGIVFDVVVPNNSTRTNYPFVSVGNGRIEFSSNVVDELKNYKRIKYAEVHYGIKKESVNKDCVAIRFYEDKTQNSFSVSPKKQNGKPIKGFYISNKELVKTVFGEIGLANKMTRFNNVEIDSQFNIVLVNLND